MTMTWTPELEAMVKAMLQNPEGYPWTLQGFGMLRCDLAGREYRLHIWDRRYRVDEVADIHDHPWTLESLIMSGRLTNVLWSATPARYEADANLRHKYWGVEMQPGPITGNEDKEEPFSAELDLLSVISYVRGDTYAQDPDELHHTEFVNGTVTLVRRSDRKVHADGTDRAHVYWPKVKGGKRITAAPRPATPKEVQDICTVALAMWGENVGEGGPHGS